MSPTFKGKIREIECLRGLAALYVLVHHLQAQAFPSNPIFLTIFRFGQEAVMLFFVVSGFVIQYSFVNKQNIGIVDYYYGRFIRIYPVFIVSLLLSFLVMIATNDDHSGWLRDLAGNLAMLQDRERPGGVAAPFANNSPLWSLSYEWWFYVLFPLLLKLNEKLQPYMACIISTIGLVLVLCFEVQIARFAMYFVIWWSGVELCRVVVSRQSPKGLYACILMIVTIVCVFSFLAKPTNLMTRLGDFPILEIRHFLSSLVAILVVKWALADKTLLTKKIIFPFFRVGSLSYALYVVHFPIMLLIFSYTRSLIISAPLTVCLSIAVAYLLDVKMQPLVASLLSSRVRRERSKLAPSLREAGT